MNTIQFIDRRNTDCYKWDSVEHNADLVPLWVADMDIATPQAIVNAVTKRAQHAAYGYVKVPKRYYNAVTQWFDTRHNWKFSPDDIIYTTGVIPAVSAVIKAVNPGGNVLMFTPVYNHFYSSIRNNDCTAISCPLIPDSNNVFHIDFEDFEQKCKTYEGILLLCNPHNPCGRVFTEEELTKVAEICKKYNIFVISDEIHCEIILPGFKFIPFGIVADRVGVEYAQCSSPSKAFNTASLLISNIICKNPDIRAKIDRAININECCDVNPFGVEALITAYTHPECLQFLSNLSLLIEKHYLHAKQRLINETDIAITPLEGTYLMWINCKKLNKKSVDIEKELLEKYKVWINPGSLYGEDGEGYMRINLATSPQLLDKGLNRLIEYYNNILNQNQK